MHSDAAVDMSEHSAINHVNDSRGLGSAMDVLTSESQ